jgi:hypothetical protein
MRITPGVIRNWIISGQFCTLRTVCFQIFILVVNMKLGISAVTRKVYLPAAVSLACRSAVRLVSSRIVSSAIQW